MSVRVTRLAAALALPVALSAQQRAAAAPGSGGVVPLPPVTLPRTHAPRPTGPAITAADLMTRLYIFADDSMQGREAGTIGDVRGTNYIAGELRRMGLVPAGDSGTYFQTIPLRVRTLDAASTLSASGTALAFGTDWMAVSRAPARLTGVPVVYGGDLADPAHRIDAAAARGKLVVFAVHGSWRTVLRAARRGLGLDGAAGVAIAALDSVPANVRGFLTRPATLLDDPSEPSATGPATFLVSDAAAATMLGAPLASLSPGAVHGTADLDLRYETKDAPYPARNVVGIIPGSDPALRGEYVAVGAHNDHIGMTAHPVDHDSLRIWNHIVRPEGADDGAKRATPAEQAEVDSELAAWRAQHRADDRPDSIDNGADDDGSGTVSALEIAERIEAMRVKPRRSILFVFHVGEEKGLLGSRYYTDHPTVPRDSIVAQLNMDMVGRGDASDETGRTKDGAALHGGANYLQLVGSRRLSTELGDLVERVNTEDHHGFRFDYSLDANGHPANIYCRSDHYEYARYGIPIVFFTTGLHSDYHQVTDEPQYIDYAHMARVASLVEDIAVHVADLDHRPVVDHAKPDPHGACRQ